MKCLILQTTKIFERLHSLLSDCTKENGLVKDTCLRLLAGEDVGLKISAIHTLEDCIDEQSVLSALQKELQNKNPWIRLTAASSLEKVETEEIMKSVTAVFLDALSRDEPTFAEYPSTEIQKLMQQELEWVARGDLGHYIGHNITVKNILFTEIG